MTFPNAHSLKGTMKIFLMSRKYEGLPTGNFVLMNKDVSLRRYVEMSFI